MTFIWPCDGIAALAMTFIWPCGGLDIELCKIRKLPTKHHYSTKATWSHRMMFNVTVSNNEFTKCSFTNLRDLIIVSEDSNSLAWISIL